MATRLRQSFVPLLFGVAVVSFAVRVGVIAATPSFRPTGDAADYDAVARAIAATGRFPATLYARPGSPTALRPPGYPCVLAFLYKVVGHSWTAGRILGAILGVATVLLIVLIALRLWGWRTARTAGVLAAIYPPLVMVNGSLLSEALFLPLTLTLVLLMLSRSPRRQTTLTVLAAGVLCGLAALTRSVGLVLLVPVLIWIWQGGADLRRRALTIALALVTTAAMIAPWTLRNAHAFRAFIPITTQDWVTAVGTYNSDSGQSGRNQGVWRPFFFTDRYKHVVNDGRDEHQLDVMMRSETLGYVSRHPTYPALVFGLNTLRLFGLGPGHVHVERLWYGEMGIPVRAQSWTRWSVYALTLLALLTLLTLRPLRRSACPPILWLVPALLLLSVVFIHGGPRYRVPADPFIVLVAAAGLVAFTSRCSPRRVSTSFSTEGTAKRS